MYSKYTCPTCALIAWCLLDVCSMSVQCLLDVCLLIAWWLLDRVNGVLGWTILLDVLLLPVCICQSVCHFVFVCTGRINGLLFVQEHHISSQPSTIQTYGCSTCYTDQLWMSSVALRGVGYITNGVFTRSSKRPANCLLLTVMHYCLPNDQFVKN